MAQSPRSQPMKEPKAEVFVASASLETPPWRAKQSLHSVPFAVACAVAKGLRWRQAVHTKLTSSGGLTGACFVTIAMSRASR